jgi:2'-5' RNA ligase
MEQIRSFIAIELPDKLRRELGQLEGRLKSSQPFGIKWIDPEGIHLTLKFLGNITAKMTGEITGAMESAVLGIIPFQLEIKDLGAFPNLKRVQVVWVGIAGQIDRLVKLQQNIESNLERFGFAPEARAFTPHLTLARLRNQVPPQERQKLGQLIADTKFEAGTFKVETVNLIKSQLTREGAIYSQISSVRLAD